jgi:hypothetical protein
MRIEQENDPATHSLYGNKAFENVLNNYANDY